LPARHSVAAGPGVRHRQTRLARLVSLVVTRGGSVRSYWAVDEEAT
jgi:hypothetical protein